MGRGRKSRRLLANTLRGCPRAPRNVMVDGVPYVPDACPEPGCWGVRAHSGLHSDGKARWTAKGRPVIDKTAGGGA